MPRPRKVFHRGDYERLRDHRADGGNQTTAAETLNMTPRAFKAALVRDERARLFWEWGKGQREFWLVQRMHDPDIKNKVPVLFELKSKHGWVEQATPQPFEPRIEITNLQLPAPLTPDQWNKLQANPDPKLIGEAS